MVDIDLLSRVKTALRKTSLSEDLQQELQDLIEAALADLKRVGVSNLDTQDPLIRRAVITYCRAYFYPTEDFDKLKASYDEQKAQLMTTTGYTDWPGD